MMQNFNTQKKEEDSLAGMIPHISNLRLIRFDYRKTNLIWNSAIELSNHNHKWKELGIKNNVMILNSSCTINTFEIHSSYDFYRFYRD